MSAKHDQLEQEELKNIISQTAVFSSKYELRGPDRLNADKVRIQGLLESPFFYNQERQNRMQHAQELISMFKVVNRVESEIKRA